MGSKVMGINVIGSEGVSPAAVTAEGISIKKKCHCKFCSLKLK